MKHQSGNALWFILVAIGLLGLLTVMMSRSSSSTNETGGYEQNIIHANKILSYAKSMENAVQSLLARGCSENDISFWHDSDGNGTENGSDDYFNANSPTDRSCHVFDVAGAGLTWTTPNENWLDQTQNAQTFFGDYTISTGNRLTSLETNNLDLLIFLSWIPIDLCESINNLLFSSSDITQDNAGFSRSPFAHGNYSVAGSNITLSSPLHSGEASGCFTSQTNGGFHFYHALHAR